MSLRPLLRILPGRSIAAAVLLAGALAARPQYPGQVSTGTKDVPALRSIGVLEWTGPDDKPKASRLVPVLVYDNGQLEDGGIYLARPWPLAVAPEVEYELQQNGKPVGLFDVESSGRELGSWVGFGARKPVPNAPPPAAKPTLPEWGMDNQEGDRPTLHRKKHPEEASASSGSAPGQADGAPTAPSDPDRPVLHKSKSAQADDSSAGSPASDPAASTDDGGDRPVLHKRDAGSDSAGASAPSSDPDRPVLHKGKKPQASDLGDVSALPGGSDPDRPRLKRGRANTDSLQVAPSLVGLPPDLEQSVAVSDSRNRPEHPFLYAWSDPALEAKMKSSLEAMARDAAGLEPPPAAPKSRTASMALKTASASRSAKPAAQPAPPAPLIDERFAAFELTYGAEPTLVLTARCDTPLAQQKFVTIVAQPDFYGNLHVLLKSVGDAAHLDDNPRLRLVDAVDALGDNRGELLFEMRGATARQFALYRVARGQAEKLFVTGAGEFGEDPEN